jgi:ankyrin repeat protein
LRGEALQDALNANRRRLRDRTSKYALYDYASRYWSDHLRLSTFADKLDEETAILLDWFGSERSGGVYESWQQMYHHDTIWYCGGRSPLFYAIEFKIDNLVSLLLPEKENLDTLVLGHAPLHVASRCGALSTVRELIRRGASLELRSLPEAKNMTALHFAAEGGHADVVSLLLKLGASPHSRSESMSIPLYRAARSGSLETLRLLYEAGSDINARTWDNFTPLFEALAYARVGIANQLLQWGADPTILTDEGNSPLSLITLAKDHRIKQEIRGSFEWMGKEKMRRISVRNSTSKKSEVG